MLQQPVITLLSDFGLRDSYVAEMKGVILSRCPSVKLVDVSHEVDKFDIRMGAFVLASAAPYFPKGSVHIAVVDPGVGTKRRPIIVETKRSYFIGPDNGLLLLAASLEGLRRVCVIENPQHMLPKVSKTFHGRDVFAPAAASLAKGCRAPELGIEIEDYLMPSFAKPCLKQNVVFGEVLHVDSFGNIITNISSEILKDLSIGEDDYVKIEIGKVASTLKLCFAYGEVSSRHALAVVGGHDFLEVAVNQGSAAERFKAKSGDSISVQR